MAEPPNYNFLNTKNLCSANVGAPSANVISTTAKVMRHIERQGFFVTRAEPTDAERAQHPRLVRMTPETGYNAQRTALGLPLAHRVVQALQNTVAQHVISLPASVGSLPRYVFEQELGVTTLTVPVANCDNNQHAENENSCLGNPWDGIETMTLKQGPATYWLLFRQAMNDNGLL